MTLLVNSNNTQAKVNLNLFFFLLLAFFLFVLMMDDVEKNSRKSVHIRVNYFHFFVLPVYYVRLIPLKIMIIMMGGCRPAAARRVR